MVNHYVDCQDPQRDPNASICTCGWVGRIPDAEDMSPWDLHIALMAMAKGHVYANTWITADENDGEDWEPFVKDEV